MVWAGVAGGVLSGGRVEVSGANSMVHAADCAAAVALVLEKPDECAGEVYNCIDDGLVSTREVAETLGKLAGTGCEIVEVPGDAPVEFANGKIRALGADFRGAPGIRAHCEDLLSRLG
jgi:nucleoside-diphosphate-sugar epimerase